MNEFFQIGIFPIILTLVVFRIGQLCQQKWKLPLFNPTLIGMILVVVFLLVTKMDPAVYTAGTAHMAWLMTPATISLAIPMYEQFQVLRKNLSAVVLGVVAGTVACLGFLLVCGLLLRLEPTILVSLLPKSVTTAIGVPLSELYGGMGALTTAGHHRHWNPGKHAGHHLVPPVPDHRPHRPRRGLRHLRPCYRHLQSRRTQPPHWRGQQPFPGGGGPAHRSAVPPARRCAVGKFTVYSCKL